MTPAVQSLIAARPKAALHLAAGIYGDVLAGFEAQATIWRDYIATECVAGRLPKSEADALVELAGSDFWSNPDRSALAAVGEVQLTRVLVNASASATGQFQTGTIKNGTRFALVANQSAKPSVQAAQYSASEDVYVGSDDTSPVVPLDGGTYQHAQTVTVPIAASVSGQQANTLTVIGEDPAQGTILNPLFDSTFTVALLRAAGGSTGVDDPWFRVIAASELAGFFGANNAALVAGAMEVPRVRHLALSLDTDKAIAQVFVGDVSWAASDRMRQLVAQNIAKTYQGWGCRVSVLPIQNQLVGTVASVTLDSAQSITASSDIAANIRTALRSYFDDRPDWYTFGLSAVRAIIAQSDNRILTCPTASVRDQFDAELSPPPRFIDPTLGYATHFYLLDDAVRLTFSAPS